MLKENLVLIYCLETQSLVYEIGAEYVYEGFYEDKDFLILVIIHRIQSSLILPIRKSLVK